jgi:hypothetical protein
MQLLLTILCVAGGLFLILMSVYAELHDVPPDSTHRMSTHRHGSSTHRPK